MCIRDRYQRRVRGDQVSGMGTQEERTLRTACQFLAAYKYCRDQANTLRRCQATQGASCRAETAALEQCATKRLADGSIQADLVAIGASECKPEAEAIRRQQEAGGDRQQMEMALLNCAASAVVRGLQESNQRTSA
eukprot:TRINITY_DN50365_c0_g2_i1.p1 TRINITY_DN50365_c0_g2~~TRINITY_DN50365_c0_g2_i1.p1  ORF type:complete len:136 (+),score=36.05 TRINITY_DN50365_c0_g2_i1:109-516(+)